MKAINYNPNAYENMDVILKDRDIFEGTFTYDDGIKKKKARRGR